MYTNWNKSLSPYFFLLCILSNLSPVCAFNPVNPIDPIDPINLDVSFKGNEGQGQGNEGQDINRYDQRYQCPRTDDVRLLLRIRKQFGQIEGWY